MIIHFEYIKLHARENFPNKMNQNGHFTLSDVEHARWNDCREIHWNCWKYENIHKIYCRIANRNAWKHGRYQVPMCQFDSFCQCVHVEVVPVPLSSSSSQCDKNTMHWRFHRLRLHHHQRRHWNHLSKRNDAHHISARFSQFHFIAFAPRSLNIPSVDAIVVFSLIKCLWSFWFDCIR